MIRLSIMDNIMRGAKNCFDNALHGSSSTAKEVGAFLWDNAKKTFQKTAKWLGKQMEKYYKKGIGVPVKIMDGVADELNGETKKEKKGDEER